MRTFCTVSRYCCLELFSFRNVHLTVSLYHLPQRQLVTWCSVVVISELDGRGEVLIYRKWWLKKTLSVGEEPSAQTCLLLVDALIMISWVWTKLQHQDRYRVICCLLLHWHQPLTNTVLLLLTAVCVYNASPSSMRCTMHICMHILSDLSALPEFSNPWPETVVLSCMYYKVVSVIKCIQNINIIHHRK